MNPRPGLGPDTMSTPTPALVAASVTVVPGYPLLSQTWVLVGARRLALRSSFGKAVRSCALAGVTTAATRIAPLSRRAWRLTPSMFLAPCNPRGPATGEAVTEDESTTAAVGRVRRPERVRTSPRIAVSTLAQVPARHQLRTCVCAAELPAVTSCGGGRRAHPVGSTYGTVSRYSRHRSGWQGRPLRG
jgi:hypothetical protein